jgi:alpha/beta superfamily hydrolase
MPIYAIVILVVVIIVILYALICFMFSGLLVHSHRQPIIRTPKDYGISYEDIEFNSTDGLRIKGWYIPGKLNKLIIITHPFPFNRHGFETKNQSPMTQIKLNVDLLKTAESLNKTGYSILMFDFRNHGESEAGITGIGLNEYQDVLGALDYVHQHPDLSSMPIGFVSFCMGANSTIIAMSKGKEKLNNVKCLVAVQPISISVFLKCFIKKSYTAAGLILIPLVNKMCQWRGGYDFKDITPLPYCRDISVPALFIQARTDPWTELHDIQSIYDATPEPKELLMLEGKMERFDTYNYVGEHPESVTRFLSKYLTD